MFILVIGIPVNTDRYVLDSCVDNSAWRLLNGGLFLIILTPDFIFYKSIFKFRPNVLVELCYNLLYIICNAISNKGDIFMYNKTNKTSNGSNVGKVFSIIPPRPKKPKTHKPKGNNNSGNNK